MNGLRFSFQNSLFFIITAKPPTSFFIFHLHIFCSNAFKNAIASGSFVLSGAFQCHHKNIISRTKIKMILFYKWSQLAEITKCKNHTHCGK